MAATFSWVEYNATAGDTSVPTNLNLGSTNAADLAPSTYPITAGTYSYSKWVRGRWTQSFTRIENLQFWMSSSGSGYVGSEKLNYSGTTGTYDGTSTFATPTTDLDVNGGTLKAMIIADPAAANIGFTGSLTASLTDTGYCDFIVIQASIGAGAAAGATQTKQFRLQYDEV
jgi:hypothetical protein